MKKSIRERIDRARCNPANIRDARRQSAQRAWRNHGETFRRAVAKREEQRRARADAGHDAELVDPDYCEPRDETTPYPHEPGYHLTVNGETTVFVDYSAALYQFVEVLNGALETNLAVKMDLVGHGVTMGFAFERTTSR